MGVRFLISGGSAPIQRQSQYIITDSVHAFYVGKDQTLGTLNVDTTDTIVSVTGDVPGSGTAALRVFNVNAGASTAALEVGVANTQAAALTARTSDGITPDRVTLSTSGAWDLILAPNNVGTVIMGPGQMTVKGNGSPGNIFEVRTSANVLKASITDAGDLNAQFYSVQSMPGANFNGAITNLTIVNGLVTAAS